MSDSITFTVARADIETALKRALLERSPYSHDEAPLLQAARHVVKAHQQAIADLIAGQVKSLVDDATVAAVLRERLHAALAKAIEEKAGSIVGFALDHLTKADIAKLLAPTLEGAEP